MLKKKSLGLSGLIILGLFLREVAKVAGIESEAGFCIDMRLFLMN